MKYGYNTRSEVISAERFFGSDPQAPGAPVAGQNWDYDYDHIGNRKTAARDGDTEVYTANNLNQYTERTVSGAVSLSGTAAEDATVTINRPTISGITVEPVTRQGTYFHKKLVLDNSSRADVEEIAVVGVLAGAGTNGMDIVSSYSGVVWAAQSPEQFSYDADGNMLADALRKYEWDGENRLIAVTVSNVADGSLTRVEMAYDYMSRRSLKKVFQWVNGQWSMVSSRSFLYDGWNLISEVCAATGRGTISDYYIWGLDLSGSLQGAGGIGGLLARYRSEQRYYDEQGMLIICHSPPGNPENRQTIRINEAAWPAHAAHGDTLGTCAGAGISNSAFLYTYDGNGNVSELLLSSVVSPLSSVAHYEYSPFGELLVASGPEAADNPFRFSTKYFVGELGIGDWGRRWYLPPLGRWLSRDPVGEEGGISLYAFVDNCPISRIDRLGQDITDIFFTPNFHGTIEAYGARGWFGNYQQICARRDPTVFCKRTAEWGQVDVDAGVDWATRHIWATTEGRTDFSKAPASTTHYAFSTWVKGTVEVKGCCPSKTLNVYWSITAAINPAKAYLRTTGQVGLETPVVACGSNSQVRDAGMFQLDISSRSASFAIDLGSTWRDDGDPAVIHSGAGVLEVFVSCHY